MVFGQVPEVEGLTAAEPTPITGLDGERESTPSRDIEESGPVIRPAKQEAWRVCTSRELGEVFERENNEGGMLGEDGSPLRTLVAIC